MVDRITVLVVDDNPILRETLCDTLHTFYPDWRVMTASNGLEGVEIAQRDHPNLIILDFHMPVMNGYEMALRLRDGSETCQIPLVLNTGEDSNHPLVKRLQSMCNAILDKPFMLHDFECMLNYVLNQRFVDGHDRWPFAHFH